MKPPGTMQLLMAIAMQRKLHRSRQKGEGRRQGLQDERRFSALASEELQAFGERVWRSQQSRH
jgi:hypothetical protein